MLRRINLYLNAGIEFMLAFGAFDADFGFDFHLLRYHPSLNRIHDSRVIPRRV